MVSTELQSDLVLFFGAVLFELIIILVPKTLKHRGIISGYIARKIIHSFAGLAVFIAPYMTYPVFAVVIAAASVIMTFKSGESSKTKMLRELYDAIHEEEEKVVGYLQGPFAYSMAITILTAVFIFFPAKYYFPISAILIMMYSDTLASIIGKNFGKHIIHIPWLANKRTVEGSLAFFISAFVLSFLTFWLFGQIIPGNSTVLTTSQVWILTLIMSTISTVLELCSPSKYDDLIVPLGSSIIISLCAVGLAIW